MKKPVLFLVIPCFNEQEVLPVTSKMFLKQINSLIEKELISSDSKILFVNDGAKDKTWDIILDLSKQNNIFKGISLSRNRGHQNALLAGLMYAKDKCDITISIDCDGQDDITVTEQMVREYLNGCEVVYGIRSKRETDTFFKRHTAQAFYRLMKAFGADTVYNHADYRLLSSKALQALAQFKEVNIYLRGMVPLVGFKSTGVYYERTERVAGKSHYPFKKMLSLAIDGITSLSTRPIRLVTALGIAVTLLSLLLIIWSIVSYVTHHVVAGWASTVAIICFFGGIQILSIGIIGEYIGKIYLETKARPKYIISNTTDDEVTK